MQKRANRILSALLVLVMVLSMLPATVFATGEAESPFKGWSLTLGENIGVNFYLAKDAAYTAAVKVGGVQANYEQTETNDNYVITVKVAAAQMTDTIALTVKNGDEVVHTDNYSVRQYAEKILAENSGYDVEVKDMVLQMLNYGAYAQKYFNYKATNLANKGYELTTAATVPGQVPAIAPEGSAEGVSLYGMSLVFESKTAVRFYFTVNGKASDHTFKVGETALTPVYKDGMYYVEVAGINPQDLDKAITVIVDGTLSVSYSPMMYVARKYNSAASSVALKELVQAMYGYHLEALEYQEYQKIIQLGTLQELSNITPWVANENETFIDFNTVAYTATTGEYTSLTADAIKLVRGGEVYSVANPGQGLLIKESESGHKLKITPWGMTGGHLPIQAHDYFIIEGRFVSTSGDGTTIQIAKSYIYYDGTNVEVSAKEPSLPIQLGTLQPQSGITPWVANENETFIDFNTVAYTATTGEYTSLTADAIKLVRGGEVYSVANPGQGLLIKESETGHKLKLTPWGMTGGHLPIQAHDYFIIEGCFVSTSGDGTTIQIEKSYIYYDGTNVEVSATEPILPTTIEVGTLKSHDNNTPWVKDENETLIYFNTDAYAATTGEYAAVSADAVKLVRNGETFNVANPGQGLIIKDNDTQHLIKLAPWTITGGHLPIQAYDYFIIEGVFAHRSDGTQIKVSKSYIYYDGSKVVVSDTVPVLPISVGILKPHDNNTPWVKDENETLIYFNTDAYAATTGEYAAVSADAVKLVRNGETFNVANPGQGLIIKDNDTQHLIKLAPWTITGGHLPIQAYDYFIIEGVFAHRSDGTQIKVSKSYIYYNGTTVVVSDTEPVPTKEVDCGVMRENEDGTPSDIYFTMDANSVPVDEENAYPYSGSVKLVSNGEESTLGADIYKTAENQYYLDMFGQELADKDYLIVEGAFSNADNGYTMNITKTYVLVDGESLIYSETEPVLDTEIAISTMKANGTELSNGTGNIYGIADANDAPFKNWDYEYTPVSAENLKLVRNGVEYNVGNPGEGTIVKYSETNYCVKAFAWTVAGNKLPLVPGDILIVEGKYTLRNDSSVVVNFAPTYILITSATTATMMSEMPNVVHAGTMTAHNNNRTANGFYAKTDANNAPFNGWSLRYKPLAKDVVKCVIGDATSDVANIGGEMLVKTSESEYFIEGWTLSGTFKGDENNPVDPVGNIYIFDGLFYNAANDVYIDIDKTYILITENDEIFYHVDAGHMNTSSNAANANGIYFTMAENSAPAGAEEYYDSTDVASVKMIRNGNVINIGNVNRDNIQKINATDYFLRVEGWIIGSENYPFTTSDIFIVEGCFVNTNDGTTIKIAKSYVYYDGSAWVCSAEAPVQKNIVDVVEVGNHSNGRGPDGIYFTAATNNAPYDGWNLRYTPVNADVIKLTSNGVTTSIGHNQRETIVKYSATEYHLEGWTIGLGERQPGDVITIEGLLYNAANDVYIRMEKTTITFNADSSVTVVGETSKYINAGAMSAYSEKNWFNTKYNALYFVLDSNIAPGNTEWSVRYMPKNAANIKLVRGGNTINIANTGAETIVKIEDGLYALALDNWWWSSYAPIQDGDVLIIEGEFANASNGYTLNIDKTYITFVSNAADNVVFSTAANTEFGDVLLPNSADTLTIGMWNGSYHVFEDKQLKELQAAGITKIMGIDTQWIGTTDVNAWLDRVYSYGISVIMDLRSWDGETVPSYASHPGVLGFLMYDEPCATEFDNLATLKAKFDDIDAFDGKLFYVNLFPSCAAGTSWLGEDAWKDYSKRDYDKYYVQQFLAKLDIEVLSWDNYSLITDSSKTATGIRTDYFYNFEVMANQAKTNNLPMWYTMLSAGHGTEHFYNTPTAEELRWQMAVALTYGVQNIDHYTYVSHESDYSCMVEYETWEPTDLYYDILKVDNEYLAWDNIFMAYDWVGTGAYSANSDDAMLDKLNHKLTLSDYGISGISANENLLVGVFDYNGEQAYMVTNAGSASSSWFSGDVGDGKNFSMADASVTLTLADGDYKCVAVIDNGEISYVAVENNTVTLNVEAYEGVFVIPVLN